MSQPAQQLDTRTGIYPGISNADYHADKDSYSSSLIKKMGNPAEAKWSIDNPGEYKEAYRFGTAAHTFILEPERIKTDLLTGLDCARRSKADKLSWGAWYEDHGWQGGGEFVMENPASTWNHGFEQATGKTIITTDELIQLEIMSEAAMANPDVPPLLTGGEAELSVYWRDEETQLGLRCRPDYMNDKYITDLKTIESLDDYSISKAIANYGYDLQDAMYTEGCQVASGKYRPFVFLFSQKNPPFLSRVICLKPEEKEKGWSKYQDRKRALAECLRTGEWNGLPNNLNFGLFERSE